MSDSDDEMREIAAMAVGEVSQLLVGLESQILDLEKSPVEEEIVNDLYRKVHTIKSNVTIVPSLNALGKLARHFETCLSKIREDSLGPSKECINSMLEANDLFLEFVTDFDIDDKSAHKILEKRASQCGLKLRRFYYK